MSEIFKEFCAINSQTFNLPNGEHIVGHSDTIDFSYSKDKKFHVNFIYFDREERLIVKYPDETTHAVSGNVRLARNRNLHELLSWISSTLSEDESEKFKPIEWYTDEYKVGEYLFTGLPSKLSGPIVYKVSGEVVEPKKVGWFGSINGKVVKYPKTRFNSKEMAMHGIQDIRNKILQSALVSIRYRLAE